MISDWSDSVSVSKWAGLGQNKMRSGPDLMLMESSVCMAGVWRYQQENRSFPWAQSVMVHTQRWSNGEALMLGLTAAAVWSRGRGSPSLRWCHPAEVLSRVVSGSHVSHSCVSSEDRSALALLAGTHWPIRDGVSDSGSDACETKRRNMGHPPDASQPFLNSLESPEWGKWQKMKERLPKVTQTELLTSLKHLHVLHKVEN